MEEPAAHAAPPTAVWHARDLGTVAFIGLGAHWALYLLPAIAVSYAEGLPTSVWVSAAVQLACSGFLILGARFLARMLLPAGASPAPSSMQPLLTAGVALLALMLVCDRIETLLPLLPPFDQRGENEPHDAQFWLDLAVTACGILLFCRARVVAGWCARWNRLS